MRFAVIDTYELHTIVGGEQPAAAAPSIEERARQIAREEIEAEYEMREKEEHRAWERRHPFSALLCQGDRECWRRSR